MSKEEIKLDDDLEEDTQPKIETDIGLKEAPKDDKEDDEKSTGKNDEDGKE